MTQITVELPALHGGQQPVWDSTARFKCVCCGRRWGKTHLGVAWCLDCALSAGHAWWIAPSYGVGTIGWNLAKQVLHPLIRRDLVAVREADRLLSFPGGGWLQVKTADRPDLLRGEALDRVVFDEGADIKPEAWFEAVRPTLSDRRGQAMFIGTPRGMDNWFYDLWLRGMEDDPTWQSWQSSTYDNPFIDPREIDDAREDLGELLFSQEYMAQFIVAGGMVFKPEWERYFQLVGPRKYNHDTALVLSHDNQMIESASLASCTRFFTVDLALSLREQADYTVIACWAHTPKRRTCLLDVTRMRMEGPDIVPNLHLKFDQWRPSWIAIERVAFQQAIVQQARREGLPVRELNPDKDKMSRALHAAARMESSQLWFQHNQPWSQDYITEVRQFPSGAHDDCVDTLSYAADQASKLLVGPQLVSW
jgi:predicted phage terminase large subunit-like protein